MSKTNLPVHIRFRRRRAEKPKKKLVALATTFVIGVMGIGGAAAYLTRPEAKTQ